MPRSVHLDLGVNGAFITRRWERPDSWMRLTAEIGFPYHEFCADVLDPFFSGDESYQLETALATAEAAHQYGVTIWDIYTGMATHRFHGLSHSDVRVRERMAQWMRACMRLALLMQAKRIGGHWDAISVEALESPAEAASVEGRTIAMFRDLADYAARIGIAAIYNEQMYIPTERPWTIDGAMSFLTAANQDRRGVPIYLTVDVGHQAGMAYGGSGRDLDYAAWLRLLGPFCEVIHLQQTTADASHHWPFTDEYNQRGHVRMETVLESLRAGFSEAAGNPLAAVLEPVREQILVAEIIPGSTNTETQVLRELKTSCQYLRRYVPEGGLTIDY